MDADRYRRACQLFDEALTCPTGERAAFLRAACDTDQDLYREVARMVKHDRRATGLLDRAPEHPVVLDETGRPVPREALLDAGTPLGAYRVVRTLGQGGMGTVYLATRDDVFHREVAIKIVRDVAADEATHQRFHRERQILARLEHPYIARLYDGGITEDHQPYLVMEHVDGLPIATYCDHYALTIEARLALMRKVCAAVQFAHRNLVVHRDLKPSNILINADGDPKLLDFGIAKLLAADATSAAPELTHDQRQVMTLSHASPEQVVCRPVTTATDVYGLGLILYELLCGVAPFALDSTSTYELLKLICEQPPQLPSALIRRLQAEHGVSAPDGDHPDDTRGPSVTQIAIDRDLTPERLRTRLTGDLDAIVAMALRKEPERRYASVADLEAELGHHLGDRPVVARSTAIRYRLGKLLRRHRAAVVVGSTLATLLVSLAITFVVTLLAQVERTVREKNKAEQLLGFLIDTFAVANPDAAVGETVTARELLDEGAQRVALELEDEPVLRAMMLDAMGRIYFQIGLYDQAESMIRESLEQRSTLARGSPVPMAASLSHLAVVQRDKGNIDEAEASFRQAIALAESGEAQSELATSLEGLAYLHRLQYNYDDAIRLFQRAVSIRRDLDKPRQLAQTLTDFGSLLTVNTDFDAARAILLEALSLRQDVHGDNHPEVADVLAELASLEHGLSAYSKAEKLERRALAILTEVYGDNHTKVVDLKNVLAITVGQLGRHGEAVEILFECLESLRALTGSETPVFATLASNLATRLTSLGEFDRAEALFRESLAIRLRLFGNGHPYVGQTHHTWGLLERRRGDLEAAEEHFRIAAETAERLPAGHRAVAYPKMALAELHLDRGEAIEAVAMFEEVLVELRSSHDPTHWRIAMAEAHLGRAQAALGKLDAGIERLHAALRILQAADSGQVPRQRQVLEWLIDLERRADRPEQADAHQERLAALEASAVSG